MKKNRKSRQARSKISEEMRSYFSRQNVVSVSQDLRCHCDTTSNNGCHGNKTNFSEIRCRRQRCSGPALDGTASVCDQPARSLLTKYIQPLPLPGAGIVVATPSGINQYAFTQREIARQLHPNLPPTPFWAYDDGSGLGGQAGSFGMAVVAQSGTALDVSYTSDLPEIYPDWIPVDTRLDAARQSGAHDDASARRLCCR